MSYIRYRRDLWKAISVPGDAAEIGVAEGFFSADILQWPTNFPRVYMVDRWKETPHQKGDASNPQSWHDNNLRQAIVRTSKFGNRACILRGNSVDMAKKVPDRSLAFVNIDGDHSKEGVLSDMEAWLPKLVKKGIMAFHDYENENYGVKAAVIEFWHGLIHLLPEDKPEDAGAFIIC